LLFACCDSTGLCTTITNLRRTTSGVAGNGLGATIEYLRHTTNGAVGKSLGTTIKYLRGAAGIGLGTTTKTCDAQRTAPRAEDWAPRSSIFVTQRAAPRAKA
jgi:hypothetical protein